jgi:hypothetical protein
MIRVSFLVAILAKPVSLFFNHLLRTGTQDCCSSNLRLIDNEAMPLTTSIRLSTFHRAKPAQATSNHILHLAELLYRHWCHRDIT